jgi:site-specific recombinase XerD
MNPEKPYPNFPRKQWEAVRDKVHAEVILPDKRFSALRHRCATSMIERGATLYDVQHYLCHSDPRTTMIYAHVSKDRDETIRKFLEG